MCIRDSAGAHPRRELVDEAELTVVVTGAHGVEHRGLDLDAQGLPRRLLDPEMHIDRNLSLIHI